MTDQLPAPWFEHPAIVTISVVCCWPVGLVLLLRHPRAPKWAKVAVAVWIVGSILFGIGAVVTFVSHR